jgi:hypothetical protein
VVVRKGSKGEIEGTSRRLVEITSKTSSAGWSRGARVSKTKRGKELSGGDTPMGNAQLIKNEVATIGHGVSAARGATRRRVTCRGTVERWPGGAGEKKAWWETLFLGKEKAEG